MKRAATILIIEDGKVLAISRKDDHNDFGIVGGRVEDGETFEEACIRECKEEIGLTASDLTLVFEKQLGEYHVKVFTPKSYTGTIVESDEGIVRWLTPEDLVKGKTFGEFNTELFKHIGLIK
jgi:8-oxo-dGTP pyrophosphatase MutT (NUDIX family)